MSKDTPTDDETPDRETTTSDDAELTKRQRHVISLLPADKYKISTELGITEYAAKKFIKRIRDNGVNIRWDAKAKVYHLADEAKVRRVSIKGTGSKTREANNFITELERVILRRLRAKDPLVATQTPTEDGEDMVLHFTDLHIGDVVEDEHGNEIYNTDIACAYAEHVTQKTLDLAELMNPVSDVDTLHVLWGGDMLTNENIYEGQAFDIDRMLADQLSAAVNALTLQLVSFANAFPTVQVVAQPGNHGKTRASGVSKQANMDLVAYRWIQDRLADLGVENVHFVTGEATWYRSFSMRDGRWTGWLTHGQDSLAHVDATSSSSKKWRGWLLDHGFDVAYRGHYHESRREEIQRGPFVFESPSPKPSGEFAARIGQPDLSGDDGAIRRLATVHGVGESRPVTWQFVLDDADMSADDFHAAVEPTPADARYVVEEVFGR